MRVELIGLGLHRSPGATEGPAAEALRDEAPGAGLACGVEQNVGSAGGGLVGSRGSPIEMPGRRGPGPVVGGKARTKCRRSGAAARSVIWWMTASGFAAITAARMVSASRPSATIGSAPNRRTRSVFAALRVVPITE